MACFVVSAAVGVGAAVARHVVKRHENKLELEGKTPEIEKFGSTKKRIIALYTDSRECSKTFLPAKNEMLHEVAECQYSYLNLLLVGAIKRYGTLCTTIDQVIDELKKVAPKYLQEFVD